MSFYASFIQNLFSCCSYGKILNYEMVIKNATIKESIYAKGITVGVTQTYMEFMAVLLWVRVLGVFALKLKVSHPFYNRAVPCPIASHAQLQRSS